MSSEESKSRERTFLFTSESVNEGHPGACVCVELLLFVAVPHAIPLLCTGRQDR